ncbi:MAG: hypothetical protein HY331_19005 [Chloroflexi bacterium]|nr:hypothetical protein [Chloroflexota bacterium]
MKPSNRALVLGLVLGSLGGLVVGSVIAMQLGERTTDLIRAFASRLLHKRPRVRFELLLQ